MGYTIPKGAHVRPQAPLKAPKFFYDQSSLNLPRDLLNLVHDNSARRA